ncbi:cilia- and flagella-associated protein 418 isoform X2 [Microcaecilia unicolor]|uniref:Cilia- and flagella-associated protein 418 n=1 Tax=Microcaecilia unicolor TaxID=1415580 RepID=A0A6P7Z092_9AMPH|nr:protein C8orf37 homolog isoform X2 [Microcaecilia unicolor]
MADDLDELLDEVESKFCRTDVLRGEASGGGAGTGSYGTAAAERNRSSNSVMRRSKEDDDIEGLIEDIFHNVRFDEEMKPRSHTSDEPTIRSSIQMSGKKCCPVYVGGSKAPYGIGTNLSQRTCDHLRCTACDFNVVIYDDYQWDTSCDYLFFRNHMPEFSRLQEKMIRKKGTRAYACQCSWRSIKELTDLASDQHLHWVCGKHAE